MINVNIDKNTKGKLELQLKMCIYKELLRKNIINIIEFEKMTKDDMCNE